MQKLGRKSVFWYMFTIVCVGLLAVTLVKADPDEDLEKKYAPILGDYSFDMTSHGYGVLKVTFYVENNNLCAITEVSSTPGIMETVEGKEFEFTIEDPDEGTYQIKFLKDEGDKFTKCHLFNETMGMDVTGEKVT